MYWLFHLPFQYKIKQDISFFLFINMAMRYEREGILGLWEIYFKTWNRISVKYEVAWKKIYLISFVLYLSCDRRHFLLVWGQNVWDKMALACISPLDPETIYTAFLHRAYCNTCNHNALRGDRRKFFPSTLTYFHGWAVGGMRNIYQHLEYQTGHSRSPQTTKT